MTGRTFDLSDLLTAAGVAMGHANQRLRALNAPALLQNFTFMANFSAGVQLGPSAASVMMTELSSLPDANLLALMRCCGPSVQLSATYIAAPSLSPIPPSPCEANV
jgi:hypothetical protein